MKGILFLSIFEKLSLVPTGLLQKRFAAEIFQVYDVLKLWYEFVTLSAVKHQLRACILPASWLDKLETLFESHVLLHDRKDVDCELGGHSGRDLDVEQNLPVESFDLRLFLVFLHRELF